MNFILTLFDPKTRKIIAQVLAYIMIASTLLGFVNPPAPPAYVPEKIITQTDSTVKMTLISGGESQYVIVKGLNASPSENTAAAKLQSYLKQISGVELPIIPDASAIPTAKEIIIGKTNREGAGYTVDRAALGENFILKPGNSIHLQVVFSIFEIPFPFQFIPRK